MKTLSIIIALSIGFQFQVSAQASNLKSCISCAQLKNLRLPDVTILTADALPYDTIEGQIITVPFCRVLGRISKEINFELLLPQQWNGRFLMSGGGGFVGSIQNGMRYRTNEGYVSVGTDTGGEPRGGSEPVTV